MNNNINHSELLKATKKAVNSFMFNPTSAKQKVATDALASLVALIESVEPKAAEPKAKSKAKPKAKAKSKAAKAAGRVRRPKRSSAAGLEQAQAKSATANKVGKVAKTKVVHAITEGDAQPFEPRKEVVVAEPKARKKAKMKLTLLPGETPEEAMARHRSAELERIRLEAEALIAATCPTSDDLPF
jgi:hydroxylamine reductase (hybrid-cluster protein)